MKSPAVGGFLGGGVADVLIGHRHYGNAVHVGRILD